MAIIDLRNLVDSEYDTIEFTGNTDKKVYSCPVKKNNRDIFNVVSIFF